MSSGALKRFGRVVTSEPTLLSSAIRTTMLAFIAFGVRMSMTSVAATMIAFEAWLALGTRVAVTPNRRVAQRVDAAADQREAEIRAYLDGADTNTP